jgi:hypothetical protein
MKNEEKKFEEKLYIMNKILDDVHDIFVLIQPLLEELLKVEEAKRPEYIKKLNKSAKLFKEIASLCKELEEPELMERFSNKLNKATYFI